MDKIFHFLLYAIVGCYITSFSHNALISLSIMVSLAALDEFVVQPRFKSKTSDWRDFIADVIGATIGIGAFICLTSYFGL